MKIRGHLQGSNEGIALVLVLGILSILLILGVAFATALRTEQLATRNSIDSLRARQLVDVAVAEALDTIDAVRDETLEDFIFQTSATNSGELIFMSAGATGEFITKSEILAGSARSFLPPSIITHLTGTPDPEFIEITTPSSAPAFTGQVAFLVADVSGYIDGSRAGGMIRNHGTNVGEIALFDVRVNERTAFADDRRDIWGEFDTRPDFMMLAQPYLDGAPQTNEWMMPFSYFPTGYWHEASEIVTAPFDVRTTMPGFSQMVIGVDPLDLDTLDQAIQDSAFDSSFNSRELAANIRDYLDEDNIPGNGIPCNMCTEAVPMVNEIRLSNRLETRVELGVTNWCSTIRLDVEVWFPFEGASTQLSDFEVKLNGLAVGPFGGAPALNVLISRGEETLQRQLGQPGFEVFSLLLPEACSSVEPVFTSVRVRGEVAVVELATGGEVDDLAFDTDSINEPWSDLFEDPLIPPDPLDPAVVGYVAKQVDDPRLNWDWDNTNQWINVTAAGANHGAHTLGRENTDAMTVGTNPEQDDDTVMFVRNGMYRSPGELGNLLYDENKPWQTIRLLGPDPDGTANLVEHFAARDTEHGFVNLNALEDDILAAVFINCPVRRYPDELPGSGPMQSGNAYAAANVIINAGRNGGGYVNRADLARHLMSTQLVFQVQRLSTDVEAENLISNAYGLLGTRQNLFVIYAVAQVFAPKSRIITAERRAVALAWRDPFPNPDDPNNVPGVGGGRHTAFVRNVVWLNE
jgi:hypothetical protein